MPYTQSNGTASSTSILFFKNIELEVTFSVLFTRTWNTLEIIFENSAWQNVNKKILMCVYYYECN